MWRIVDDDASSLKLQIAYCELVSEYPNDFHGQIKKVQKLAKTWIYLAPYVCTEQIFDSRLFIYKNIFLQKLL